MLRFVSTVSTAFFIILMALGYPACAIEKPVSSGMTTAEALSAIKEIIPEVKVLEVNATPVQGLVEVVVESKGQKGIVYLDSSRKHLVSGSIVDIATKQNLTQKRFSEINKVNVSEIPLDDALVMGDKNAPKRVIVFTDPDWPYCARLHQEMKKVLEERKDIVFYIKLYPLPMHKDAYGKSKTILCEKSLALLEDAFAKKPVPPAKCESSAIDDNLKLAEKLGIRGTPAIILPNGIIIPGYRDAPSLVDAVDKASWRFLILDSANKGLHAYRLNLVHWESLLKQGRKKESYFRKVLRRKSGRVIFKRTAPLCYFCKYENSQAW